MAIHRYICKNPECKAYVDLEFPVGVSPTRPTSCSYCGGYSFRRDFSGVGLSRPMMEHWNATTGSLISDPKNFKEALKRKSEEATLKSGIEHNFEPIDYADMEKVVRDSDGVGLESTNRVRAAEGKRTIDL